MQLKKNLESKSDFGKASGNSKTRFGIGSLVGELRSFLLACYEYV